MLAGDEDDIVVCDAGVDEDILGWGGVVCDEDAVGLVAGVDEDILLGEGLDPGRVPIFASIA